MQLQMVAHMKRSDLCNCGWWHPLKSSCCLQLGKRVKSPCSPGFVSVQVWLGRSKKHAQPTVQRGEGRHVVASMH